MNRTLFRYEMKRCFKIWLIFCGVLTMYTGMIIWMFDPVLGESLKVMAESMPEIFAMVGMDSPGTTLLDFINNYLFSFLYKVFPIVFFAFLVNRVLIRYLDKGTMGYLLASPNRRFSIIFTQASVIVWQIILLLAYVAALTVAISVWQFPDALDVEGYLIEMAGLLGLCLFLSGICFLSGCVFDDGGKALGVGVGLNAVFVLLEMVSQVGEKFEKLRYFTPLTLFDPAKIGLFDEHALEMMLALYLGGVGFYAIGMMIFCRKDLSL